MKYQKPLVQRDNDKDEAVRRASNPALAHDNVYVPTYYAKRTKDLTGKPIDQPDVTIVRRKGTHSPMSNEGPEHKWPKPEDWNQ